MPSDAAPWLWFGALLFLFMGLGLALDPEAYAQSAADWALEGGRPAREARRFSTRLCRACGFLLLGASAWLGGVAAGAHVWGGARLAGFHARGQTRLLAGAGATLVSLALSAVKMSEWAAPRRDSTAARASFWSGWAVVFTLMAFGALALSRR